MAEEVARIRYFANPVAVRLTPNGPTMLRPKRQADSCPKHPSMGPYCSCLANRSESRPRSAAKRLSKTVPDYGYMKDMGYTVGKDGLAAPRTP